MNILFILHKRVKGFILFLLWLMMALTVGAYAQSMIYIERNTIYFLPVRKAQPSAVAKGTRASISPEGKFIAYAVTQRSSQEREEQALVVYNLATGKKKEIQEPKTFFCQLSWSPKGDYIVYEIWDDNIAGTRLFIIKPDGSGKKEIFDSNRVGSPFSLRWAGDGKSLYFQNMEALYQIDLSGKILKKIPLSQFGKNPYGATSTDCYAPSPVNSKKVAFTRSVKGTKKFQDTFGGEPNSALFLYDYTTGTSTRLTPEDMLVMDPVWSYDGKFIYFTGYREENYKEEYPFKIYCITPDGQDLSIVSTGESPSLSR